MAEPVAVGTPFSASIDKSGTSAAVADLDSTGFLRSEVEIVDRELGDLVPTNHLLSDLFPLKLPNHPERSHRDSTETVLGRPLDRLVAPAFDHYSRRLHSLVTHDRTPIAQISDVDSVLMSETLTQRHQLRSCPR